MNNITEKITGKSLILMCVMLLLTAMSVNGSEKFKDSDIISTIESEFIFDPVVDFNTIDIACKEGIVTLSGNVNSIRAAQRAENIAEMLLGVKAVVNILHVETPAVPDDSLESNVENALLLNPATESFEIEVAVKNGEVMLSGNVQSWQEKYIAEEVSKGVSGVKKVNNKITVTLSAKRSDFEIKNDILQRMANDVMINDLLLKVEVHNARVVLGGKVGSLAEKKRAVRHAYVAGVKDVSYNKLKIDWWARNKMMRKAFDADRSDKEIEQAVKTAYLYDPRIMTINPEVVVENGVVTLRGTVASLMAKTTAEEDARNVSGVTRVKNHLKVRPKPSVKNETLERKIASALSIDPFIDRFEITIDTYAGYVTLSGTVSTSFEKQRVEEVVGTINGVIDIRNNISYLYTWKWKSDWEIKTDVRDQLYWDAYVNDKDISIEVHQGIVTLTGTVQNWMQWEAVERNAYEGGAKDVINNTVIRIHSLQSAKK